MTIAQRMVTQALTTDLLRNIGGLDSAEVLKGQYEASRACARRKFPEVELYSANCGTERPGHRHREFEIATVLEGSLDFVLGNRVYTPRAGDWIICEPKGFHGQVPRPSKQPYRLLKLACPRWFMVLRLYQYRGPDGYDNHMVQSKIIMPANLRGAMGRLFYGDWADRLDRRRDLLAIVHWCLNHGELVADRPNPHPAIERVLRLVGFGGHMGDGTPPPGLDELAEKVGLSPNYLSALFREQTGMTIRQVILEARMESARRLLAETDASIKNVAFTVGYSETSHFSSAFRRVTGVRPTEYRRMILKQESA